ncbi:hypothetical protein [Gloeothece verrucosa]|uniref:Uncharacterized protein n=1 Tax=Gloeothece verrucosa (strain PCC 7822) TaxID=497965 RepID=E0UDR2_GLOV7|nr:hypothetical protein [Gloeothece verrucosa]ADN16497.1 conserved hypothetical protein [Gloeothece verrucosa PCC 7822]
MTKKGNIYCFRANYKQSSTLNERQVPDWLCVDTNWQGYRIHTLPWIADVARALGLLPLEEDSPEAWIMYLESLGLKEVKQVGCEDFWEDRLFA